MDTLEDTNAIIRGLLDQSGLAVAVLQGDDNRIAYANSRFLAVAGADAVGRPMADALPTATVDGRLPNVEEARRSRRRLTVHRKMLGPRSPGARPTYWTVELVPLDDAAESLLALAFEVTREVEQQELLDALFAHAPAGIAVGMGPDASIVRVSDYAAAQLGRRVGELADLAAADCVDRYGVVDLATGEPADWRRMPLPRAALSGEVVRGEVWGVTTCDGRRIPVACDAGPIRDERGEIIGGVIIWRDVEAELEAARTLREAIEAKDTLLHETAHRVKNSLQIAASLLMMQGLRTSDPEVHDQLERAGQRIRALANVQRALYDRADFDGRVDLDKALGELCRDLAALAPDHVAVDVEAAPLAVPADTATPLLMLVNELVTNALKHAFPDGRDGRVSVGLARPTEGASEISIRDDGIGLGPPRPGGTGIGLLVAESLAAQVGGEMRIHSLDGTRFTIRFPVAS